MELTWEPLIKSMMLLRDLKRAVARRKAQLMAIVLNKVCTGFCSCKTGIHAIHGNKRGKCTIQVAPGAFRLVRALRYDFSTGAQPVFKVMSCSRTSLKARSFIYLIRGSLDY